MNNKLSNEQAWFILYQALITMDHHPGNKMPQTPKQLAEEADIYLKEFRERYIDLEQYRYTPKRDEDPPNFHGAWKGPKF